MTGDEIDPRGTTEADATAFVPEPRRPAESETSAEHIVLGYN
ncbi:hypothetical protein P3102_09030 [Amycolatopsis sp. QT-25]|nr:hypothetical protein [Amycolatopsis sp. QT-25]WET81339.1 hypothetical protein P3102_09030 [Amycolatopsis sp. QT-25]